MFVEPGMVGQPVGQVEKDLVHDGEPKKPQPQVGEGRELVLEIFLLFSLAGYL